MDLSTPGAELFDPATELDDFAVETTVAPSDLDDLVAELTAPPSRRRNLVAEIPSRPGWEIELRLEQSDNDRALISKKSDRFVKAVDAKNVEGITKESMLLSAFTLGLACQSLRRQGVVVTDAMIGGRTDDPATFTNRHLQAKVGANNSMTDAVVRFLGADVVADIADEFEQARKAWILEDDSAPRA